jgi:hypothetical protein
VLFVKNERPVLFDSSGQEKRFLRVRFHCSRPLGHHRTIAIVVRDGDTQNKKKNALDNTASAQHRVRGPRFSRPRGGRTKTDSGSEPPAATTGDHRDVRDWSRRERLSALVGPRG